MRVHVWNAYASNNSGSYTIVGALPSAEVAREVAEELAAMIDAHTAWYEAAEPGANISDSPLAAFCRTHGLTWTAQLDGATDWPEYSEDNRPRVAAVGSQVIVHHEYTISLPATFGEYFYKRGGRVTHEENHAHHPIVTIAKFWWGWTSADRSAQESRMPSLVERLTAADGILNRTAAPMWPAAWRVGDGFGHAPFTVGMVFDDLLEGVSVLRAEAESHGAQLHVRLHEAPDEEHDAIAYLRPSSPPPAAPRYDVVITHAGGHRPGVVAALLETLEIYEGESRRRLEELPGTFARSLSAERAEAAAAALRRAGATVDLVRNDG